MTRLRFLIMLLMAGFLLVGVHPSGAFAQDEPVEPAAAEEGDAPPERDLVAEGDALMERLDLLTTRFDDATGRIGPAPHALHPRSRCPAAR